MATKGLQAIGGGLGGLLGALARNKQAKASGEPGENVLQAVAAGMGGDEALEQYRKDRDERQFLAGLAEQIAAQARGTEIEPEVTRQLSGFHSANLNKQRAIVSGLGTQLKKWHTEAVDRDVAGLASALAELSAQGTEGPPEGLTPEDAAAWAASGGGRSGPRKLTGADIASALARYPKAGLNPNVSALVQSIMRAQNQGELTPYQRELLELKREELGHKAEWGDVEPRIGEKDGIRYIYDKHGQFRLVFDPTRTDPAPEGYELWTGPDGKPRLISTRQATRVLPERLAEDLTALEQQVDRLGELVELPDEEAKQTRAAEIKAAGGLPAWREQQKKKLERARAALANFAKRWRGEGYGKPETWADVEAKAGVKTAVQGETSSTPEEVRAAVRSGKLSRDKAAQILRDQFGFK